jgi:argininosuccinate synthase
VAVWLRERGADVRHYIADVGQSPREELDALASSLERCGMRAEVVDLRRPMAELTAELLRYRARHDGGYWNTVGASRLVLVRELAPRMRDDGCEVLAHGCVGGGNDQRRFARYGAALAPDLGVYAPWTDPAALARFPDRATMLEAVVACGLRLDPGSSDDRSCDANVAGASHESGALEDLRTPATTISTRWSTWPADAPLAAQTLTVRVERGRVTQVDDSGSEPLAWLGRAHEAGARNGVWLRDVLESRIIGTRCRGVYEAPALEVLDAAWERVLEVALDRSGRRLYDQFSAELGEAMYEARYLEPAAKAARAALDSLLDQASATVTLSVHRGSVMVTGVDVPGDVANQQRRFSTGGHRWAEPVRALAASSAGR